MNWRWEVYVWHLGVDHAYKYHQRYQGDSFFEAVAAVIKARMQGNACIKLEWRPQ